jgi:hypothetical protein
MGLQPVLVGIEQGGQLIQVHLMLKLLHFPLKAMVLLLTSVQPRLKILVLGHQHEENGVD